MEYLALRCRTLAFAGLILTLAMTATGAATGHVVAWGRSTRTNVPAGLKNVIAISAGQYHNLALKSDGTVTAWGDNSYGQGTVPAGISNIVAISAGYTHNLALKHDGSIVAWGRNIFGQGSVPAWLTNSNVAAISAGSDYNLILYGNGVAAGWGYAPYSQTNILNNTNIMGISAGGLIAMVVRSNGTTSGYGYLAFGSATGAKAVCPGYEHNMALLNNGTVQAWGNATWLQTSVPSSLTGVAMLSGHYYHCLALRTNGTIVGWGRYDYGQDRAPTWLTNAMAVSTGEEHSLALVPDPPPPTIHVSSSSANLILSWTTLDSYALESATNILGPFFTDAAVLTTNNSTINATIPAVEPARFFRLRKP